MTRTIFLTVALLVALAGCGVDPAPCVGVVASGCIHVTEAGQPRPPGWRYWTEDDGDEIGYYANTLPPFEATRLAWSKGPDGDIWNTFVCAYSDGTDA